MAAFEQLRCCSPDAAYAASQFAPFKSATAPQKSAQTEQPIAPPNKSPSEEAKAPASVTIIDAEDARGILGREVHGCRREHGTDRRRRG